MNPFEFVLVLMLMIFGFTIIKHRMGITSRGDKADRIPAGPDPEKQQLLQEVRQLKERVQVLERITVEKENSLARQIEELRDR
ncbi:hypothetical protein [Sphingomonas arenae]|uniref:hypothetical protein n=1 Tax=Sphingomonas arenae TaxID=2812555 RepID=UPI0019672AAC|nr:hypothetical protein [Sphingomonas arenae]